MTTLLIKNALLLATMDEERHEYSDGAMLIRDGFIERTGFTKDLPETADEVLDLSGHVVLPGLINTHHHFYQTLTRAVPGAQNSNLFNWLKTLYPIWGRMTPEDVFISTQTAMAELALSGCTTASDHLYLFPNGSRLDDEIEGARQIGLRFHASRGSMSLGESKGGLPPDSVVDSEENILSDCIRVIEKYHDPKAGSMLQIVLAPCSPFSVSTELMRDSAKLARHYGVHLHTHLAETEDEEEFCLRKFGYKPVDYMESVDWLGPDVWFAHSVHVRHEDIRKFQHFGCGVAHCPSSNMRLGSGFAPLVEYLQEGIHVGLGVDGSASNDSSHMLGEVRQALLMARLRAGLQGASLSGEKSPKLITAREVLEIATRGGAAVLGRKDIGALESGKCADFIAIDMNKLQYTGSFQDPLSALIFCNPGWVDYNFVQGKPVVFRGELRTANIPDLVNQHNKAAARLVQ
ncbi:8-oxoguanine deaminase [Flexilinea flocculi]|jgi:8-oxoguanine deaminase|uniref:Cytosine/adenosine deaminase n=1 Tax=Flexilinea flocculi TaxID=1678840 RepID=A0A0K8PBE5_9CHLR|nr:8-oxoguanine deaminase [Flexilinea flocculi]NMB92857.1 8-oxoguanine deaminase [Flexilinea flocculi]GAP39983.1 cytosine/adenosine deaminase [Flexilinea flocculi]